MLELMASLLTSPERAEGKGHRARCRVDKMQILGSYLRNSRSLTRNMLDRIVMSPQIAFVGALIGSASDLRLVLILSTNLGRSTRTCRDWVDIRSKKLS